MGGVPIGADRDPSRSEISARNQRDGRKSKGVPVRCLITVVFSGFTDGTLIAFDDTTMQQLWKFNVGVGFNAPPMTFGVGGKQYVAILAGLSRIALAKHAFTPELKEQRNSPMLFVFGL